MAPQKSDSHHPLNICLCVDSLKEDMVRMKLNKAAEVSFFYVSRPIGHIGYLLWRPMMVCPSFWEHKEDFSIDACN